MPGHQPNGDRSPDVRIEDRLQVLEDRQEWVPDEIELLREMIAVWRGVKAMRFVLGSLKQIGIWIMAFSAFVIAFRSGLLDWLGVKPQ